MNLNENIVKRLDIIKALSSVPNERLKEIDSFVKFILSQSSAEMTGIQDEPETLAGIWKGKGFEKILDIDLEIKNIRKELDNQLLTRQR